MIVNWRNLGLGGSISFNRGEDIFLRIWLGPIRTGLVYRRKPAQGAEAGE